MEYGYYTDFKELLEEYPDSSWGYLENEISHNGINPYNFLHGYCYEFAYYLQQKYGYEVECIKDDNGSLIHAYCVVDLNERIIFIDVRGMTDNWAEFIGEFDAWIEYVGELSYPLENADRNTVFDDIDENILEAAKAIDNENYDFYDINSLHEIA